MKYLVIFLCLTSCANRPNWQSSTIYSQEKDYTSKKFTFIDPVYKEMELEIIVFSDHTKCYLNFFDLSLQNLKEITLIFKTDDLSFEDKAYCLKGGQRALISDSGSEKLLECLQQGKDLSIIHNNNRLDVPAENFADVLKGKKNRIKQLITHFF